MDKIELTLREFIPHSAEYCIEPLARALRQTIADELIERLPKEKRKYGGEPNEDLYGKGYNQYRQEAICKIKSWSKE